MKKQCSLPFDRISELPSNIAQIILMFLPLRDMGRTSILSKNWRYQWVKVPQLVFKDDPNYAVLQEERYRYSEKKVFEILLLHHGSLLKFTLDMTAWSNCSRIDGILSYLSRNRIEELTLLMPNVPESYKLPSSILSCVELKHLSLSSCVFHPLTLVGLGKLVSLELLNVKLDSDMSISSCPFLESLRVDIPSYFHCFSVDAPKLKVLFFKGWLSHVTFFLNTPVLKVLSLGVCQIYNGHANEFDQIKFFGSVPILENLHWEGILSKFSYRGEHDSSDGYPTVLNNLRVLEVSEICTNFDFAPSTFWFLRNSPNLQKLGIKVHSFLEFSIEWKRCLKMQENSNYSLLKLQEVEIKAFFASWSDVRQIIEVCMFLLDITPELKMLRINPLSLEPPSECEYKALVELESYPRASPKAKIVFDGLEELRSFFCMDMVPNVFC